MLYADLEKAINATTEKINELAKETEQLIKEGDIERALEVSRKMAYEIEQRELIISMLSNDKSVNWLVKLCDIHDITLYQLSAKTGIPQSTFSYIKNNNLLVRDVKLDIVASVCVALDIHFHEVFRL